ncbi:MAG TPA: hypothetical protein VFA17_03300 [Thermoplasmata archaeon]|jgi:hypothetical protein|nr:hypothetical protein [Thermoplasmata archaeon]
MERSTNFAFVVIGFAVTLAGSALAAVCTPSPTGYCLPTPYSGVGVAAALMGGALFLVGLILVLKTELGILRPASPGPPGPPTVLCKTCGKPLAWIPTANRWYCSKCEEYR